MRGVDIHVGKVICGGNRLFLIAGPCVIEDEKTMFQTAEELKSMCERQKIGLIFKSSFQKDNRRNIRSYQGPGMEKGLDMLLKIKKQFDLPILTDIHHPEQAVPVAEVADVLQIPAMLCRQTDLLQAAAKTGKVINIKKGQFLNPDDMPLLVEKATSLKNENILITERGTTFGYQDLIVDMRSVALLGKLGYPIIIDAGHSSGTVQMIPVIARAAIAVGACGLFVETHPNPEKALSDTTSQFPISALERVLYSLVSLREWYVESYGR